MDSGVEVHKRMLVWLPKLISHGSILDAETLLELENSLVQIDSNIYFFMEVSEFPSKKFVEYDFDKICSLRKN